jgi:phage tail-like protein
MVQGNKRKDPYQAYNFIVEIEGITAAGFAECSGLSAEVESFEYREGGVNDYTHRFAGPAKYPPLVLRRGMTDSNELWNWHRMVAKGFVIRRNGTIHMLDSKGQTVKLWHFFRAYPIRWTGPDLRAGTSGVAFESIELAHEGLSTQAI